MTDSDDKPLADSFSAVEDGDTDRDDEDLTRLHPRLAVLNLGLFALAVFGTVVLPKLKGYVVTAVETYVRANH